MTDAVTSTTVSFFRCPKCARKTSLWRGVELSGWQSVDERLEPARLGSPDREVYWDQASPDGDYGCAECGWEGRRSGLVECGRDGEPLPQVHPG